MPVIALLVRLTPGPVIYRQTRVGECGRHFTILKFRTMREDAEDDGAPCYAQVGDARVTGVGRLLRQTVNISSLFCLRFPPARTTCGCATNRIRAIAGYYTSPSTARRSAMI